MRSSAGVNEYAHHGVIKSAGRAHDERPGICEPGVEKGHVFAVAPELQAGAVGRGHVGAAAQGVHKGAALRLEPALREDLLVLICDGRHDEHQAVVWR